MWTISGRRADVKKTLDLACVFDGQLNGLPVGQPRPFPEARFQPVPTNIAFKLADKCCEWLYRHSSSPVKNAFP